MLAKKLIAVALVLALLLMVAAFSFDINNGDNVSIFNNITIPSGITTTGDAVAVFGNADIKGNVRGDVVAVFGNVDIYGEVGGDVVTVFGNMKLKSTAVVDGDIVGVLGTVDRDNGAIVKGDIVDTKPGVTHRGFNIGSELGTDAASVVGLMITYALFCLILLLVPDRVAFMEQSCRHNIGRSFGIGILVFLGIMLLIPALVITIIGIIPAILIIIALIPITLAAVTAIAMSLGRKVAAAVEGKNAAYIHLLIGLVIIGALFMVPFVGFLVELAVFFVALGVAFDTRVGRPNVRKTHI